MLKFGEMHLKGEGSLQATENTGSTKYRGAKPRNNSEGGCGGNPVPPPSGSKWNGEPSPPHTQPLTHPSACQVQFSPSGIMERNKTFLFPEILSRPLGETRSEQSGLAGSAPEGLCRSVQRHSQCVAGLSCLQGSPGDVPALARLLYHLTGWAQLREQALAGWAPHGVVAVVASGDCPLLFVMGKVLPALAMGNAVVLRPSHCARLAALLLAELAAEAGLPAGTLNVLTGDSLQLAVQLAQHPGVHAVAFTGRRETPLSLSAVLMYWSVHSVWSSRGRCGPGLSDPSPSPVCLCSLPPQVIQPSPAPAADPLYPPTVLWGVAPCARCVWDPLPGPLLPALPFRTAKEGLDLGSHSPRGLAAAVWTEDVTLALESALSLQVATVWVNSHSLFDATAGPGGVKQSGTCADGGREVRGRGVPLAVSGSPRGSTPLTRVAGREKYRRCLIGNSSSDRGLDRSYKLYIGGSQCRPDSGCYRAVLAAGGAVLGYVPDGGRKDIRNAVEAASKAQSGWRKKGCHSRCQILYFLAENLEQRREEFARSLRSLTGVSLEEASKEVDLSVSQLFHWAALCDKSGGTVQDTVQPGCTLCVREPVGVLGVVCPDDAPLLSFVSLLGAAVSRGNAVVMVPSEKHPLPALQLCQVLETSDLPGGVVNVVSGEQDQLTRTLANHSAVQAVWYWGSQEVLTVLVAAALLGGGPAEARCGSGKNCCRRVICSGRQPAATRTRLVTLLTQSSWYCSVSLSPSIRSQISCLSLRPSAVGSIDVRPPSVLLAAPESRSCAGLTGPAALRVQCPSLECDRRLRHRDETPCDHLTGESACPPPLPPLRLGLSPDAPLLLFRQVQDNFRQVRRSLLCFLREELEASRLSCEALSPTGPGYSISEALQQVLENLEYQPENCAKEVELARCNSQDLRVFFTVRHFKEKYRRACTGTEDRSDSFLMELCRGGETRYHSTPASVPAALRRFPPHRIETVSLARGEKKLSPNAWLPSEPRRKTPEVPCGSQRRLFGGQIVGLLAPVASARKNRTGSDCKVEGSGLQVAQQFATDHAWWPCILSIALVRANRPRSVRSDSVKTGVTPRLRTPGPVEQTTTSAELKRRLDQCSRLCMTCIAQLWLCFARLNYQISPREDGTLALPIGPRPGTEMTPDRSGTRPAPRLRLSPPPPETCCRQHGMPSWTGLDGVPGGSPFLGGSSAKAAPIVAFTAVPGARLTRSRDFLAPLVLCCFNDLGCKPGTPAYFQP
ncbi:A16A1 dehydrogenase, partial [Atractosteus spatula]|nr:A16A1 dehydrogenase [Atractosteus spatula]